MRAVDEEQLDRFVEVVRGRLRQGGNGAHELRDPGALDVRLEIAEAVIGVRIDGVDRQRRPLLGAEPETHRRLPFPGADLDDDALSRAGARKVIERLSLLVREPAGNVGDERLDARLEFVHPAAASTAFS